MFEYYNAYLFSNNSLYLYIELKYSRLHIFEFILSIEFIEFIRN